jgi:diguanylate cyclase (GGDEF)-like protein
MAKILVIDDERQHQGQVIDWLQLNGLTVISASTDKQGLELATLSPPDLVVCEIHRPAIDGYEVLSRLRGNAATALIPVIFLTAHSDYAALRKGMQLGADDILFKSCDPNELLQAVKVQLHKRQELVRHIRELERSAWLGCAVSDRQYQDSMTGLLNLLGLEEQFNHLSAKRLHLGASLHLTIFKIENFAAIQESFGHVFGTLVLRSVAERLQSWARTAQPMRGALAYLGSTQFVVLTTELPDPMDAISIERVLKQSLEAPQTLNNHLVQLKTRFARVSYPQEAQNLKGCLLRGTRELEESGTAPGLRRRTQSKLSLEARLRRALKQEELSLYYQPQVDLKTGRIIGAEALLRWIAPDAGMISPGQFIPVAEETDLIFSLGEWLLRAVCTQLRIWHHQSALAITTAVNLSAKQFQSPSFRARLIQILNEEGVSPALIDLELTESLLVRDIPTTCKILQFWQEMGFSIAIDDFGTGYSSLGYLQQLPINILKIDKCFVRDLHRNFSNLVIVKAIMEMAHGLNISTLAEGVETAEELAALKQLNCGAMQGYLFSPALVPEEFEKLLIRNQGLRPEFLAN